MRYILTANHESNEEVFYDGHGWTLLESNAQIYTDYRRDPHNHAKLLAQAYDIDVSYRPIA